MKLAFSEIIQLKGLDNLVLSAGNKEELIEVTVMAVNFLKINGGKIQILLTQKIEEDSVKTLFHSSGNIAKTIAKPMLINISNSTTQTTFDKDSPTPNLTFFLQITIERAY